jgi:2-oxoglutarate/2-oxoacid ferredoxin oxidoreductase subunit alpha
MTAPNPPSQANPAPGRPVEEREAVTVRLAGDSGDGMQLAGSQLTLVSALAGNGIGTLADFPAEIRAPAGSLAGVSGFQVHFSSDGASTPGDRLDALVAMNPAALRTHLPDLEPGGVLIVNRDIFLASELAKAGYAEDPLEDGSLTGYRLLAIPMSALSRAAVAELKLTPREADRCKNFFALGLVYWLYERPLEPTSLWIKTKFAQNPAVRDANSRALRAGYNFGETTDQLPVHYRVPPAAIPPGRYRKVTGSEALALGLVAAAQKAGLPLLFAGHPSTPSAEILHLFAGMKRHGVRTVQAEDAAAAAAAAVGAAFGGALGATATSGPGLCLKAESIGLAVMAELPLVVLDVQRAGPSTGMPTKTEQGDLLQALFGRNGECPVVVLAPASPADCFAVAFEAVKVAIGFMTPVVVLADGHLAVGAEAWRVPLAADLPTIPVPRPTAGAGPFLPYKRDERLVRPWAVPGTAGLEHRTGGLEKDELTGDVSYDPLNHEKMVRMRAAKVAGAAAVLPELAVDGPAEGDLLVASWGSTFGAIAAAVARVRRRGGSVAHAHFRSLHPLPRNTAAVLRRYRRVLVPELNEGQLLLLLRAAYLTDAVGLHKVQGRPFLIGEIEAKIDELLKAEWGTENGE